MPGIYIIRQRSDQLSGRSRRDSSDARKMADNVVQVVYRSLL